MNKRRIKVLVVEDDHQDFLLIKTALRKSDRAQYLTNHVDKFSDAVKAVLFEEFDVVLLDYFLGKDCGYDILKQANEAGVSKPIVVMTGNSTPELDDLLMKAGAADFIPKDDLSTSFLDRTIRHAIERKSAELEIAQLVRRDPLTGLGNRIIFEEHMELAIARAHRTHGKLAVVFMDLDRFKDINDSMGHHVGDLLLTLIGDRLRRSVRKSDFVARIGGDEFTILLDNVESEEDVAAIVEKISADVSRPAPISNTSVDISVSIGVALYPKNGDLAMELMQKADMALYESKALGAGQYHFFTEHLQARLIHSVETEKALRNALANKEFELYYQPQVDLKTQEVVGLEALIRWNRADGTTVSPIHFIPVAVTSGLIIPIGQWVIEEACQQIRKWHDMGLEVPVSVNVSPRQLKYHGFTQHLLEVVGKHGLLPGVLELELTEEAFIDTGLNYVTMLDKVRSAGIRLAIDDFGTGYSSMRYLKELPLDRIKIDRGFISQKGGDGLSEPAITQSILSLAHGLDLEVVAEGVETATQLEELLQFNCRICQGFYFHKPKAVNEITPILKLSLATQMNKNPGTDTA